jgi:hypothetical protein
MSNTDILKKVIEYLKDNKDYRKFRIFKAISFENLLFWIENFIK